MQHNFSVQNKTRWQKDAKTLQVLFFSIKKNKVNIDVCFISQIYKISAEGILILQIVLNSTEWALDTCHLERIYNSRHISKYDCQQNAARFHPRTLLAVSKSKCWPFVTEPGGSIDTLHYKLGVSDFKCEDCISCAVQHFELFWWSLPSLFKLVKTCRCEEINGWTAFMTWHFLFSLTLLYPVSLSKLKKKNFQLYEPLLDFSIQWNCAEENIHKNNRATVGHFLWWEKMFPSDKYHTYCHMILQPP